MKKVIDDKMDVGMGFGWLLDRFLVGFGDQVGRQLGAKLALKPEKWDTKTMSENHQKTIKQESCNTTQ